MANEKWQMKNEQPKVAIVHDWLVGGGAEKVVLELHKLYPDAPIYTSYCTPEWRQKLDNKVITGPLQMWPFSKLRKIIPFLRVWWFTSLNFDQFDLVISSSGAEAKGIRVRRSRVEDRSSQSSNFQLPTSKPLHVAYIHAPTHYYWSRYDEYLQNPGFGLFNGLARFGLKVLVGPLRKWDYKAAQRPDLMIANSTHTQQAIQRYYDRKSTIIHPPVDVDRFSQSSNFHLPTSKKPRHGFVITGRQVPYKRIDLAVQACSQLNLPLTVIGDGPDNARLRELAGPSIEFLGHVDDKRLEDVICTSQAFLFPGVDDFGIAAVEALSAGTPVIAYKAGGALDYIIPGKTGEFFDHQTVKSLCEVLENFNAQQYNPKEIKGFALSFSNDQFAQKIVILVQSHF